MNRTDNYQEKSTVGHLSRKAIKARKAMIAVVMNDFNATAVPNSNTQGDRNY